MGIVVRIPKDMFREIYELQKEMKEKGIDLTFPQAAKMWYRKLKGTDAIKKKWRFPEFT